MWHCGHFIALELRAKTRERTPLLRRFHISHVSDANKNKIIEIKMSIKKIADQATLAILGYIQHHVLESACHSFLFPPQKNENCIIALLDCEWAFIIIINVFESHRNTRSLERKILIGGAPNLHGEEVSSNTPPKKKGVSSTNTGLQIFSPWAEFSPWEINFAHSWDQCKSVEKTIFYCF